LKASAKQLAELKEVSVTMNEKNVTEAKTYEDKPSNSKKRWGKAKVLAVVLVRLQATRVEQLHELARFLERVLPKSPNGLSKKLSESERVDGYYGRYAGTLRERGFVFEDEVIGMYAIEERREDIQSLRDLSSSSMARLVVKNTFLEFTDVEDREQPPWQSEPSSPRKSQVTKSRNS